MEKFVKFITNKWFNLGVSVLTLAYPVFLGGIALLLAGYYLEPTHEGALYTLHIFINVIFVGLSLFTRKQIITRIVSVLSPFFAFAILLFGFGNWFFVVPCVVSSIVIFFITGVGETTKIVLGTIYLIMYVVGVLVYLTFEMLFGSISFMDVDLSRRSTGYRYSSDGLYRVVLYVDPESDKSRTVSFYLEETEGDISLPFVECRNARRSIHLITSDYSKPADVEWKDDHTLYIDGRLREFDFDSLDIETEEDEDY